MQMTVRVKSVVEIELKPDAFTSQFLDEFSSTMVPIFTLEEHAEYLSGFLVSGIVEEVGERIGEDQFVEGYGRIGDFVKIARVVSTECETDLTPRTEPTA